MYMAQWGPKGFLVSPEKIVTFDNLSTSIALKSDSANDTSGKAPTNTKGRELQTVSMTINYVRAAGVDPRAQLDEWSSLVGQYNTLYIGNVPFGPEYLMLTKVDLSDLQLAPDGTFISTKIAVSFDEYIPPKPKAKAPGTTKKIVQETTKKGNGTIVTTLTNVANTVFEGVVAGVNDVLAKGGKKVLTPEEILAALAAKPKAPKETTQATTQATTPYNPGSNYLGYLGPNAQTTTSNSKPGSGYLGGV